MQLSNTVSFVNERFKGIFPALVTPFSKDGSAIDEKSLESLVEYVLSAGVSGVVVAGSTGEAALLSAHEFTWLVRRVQEIVNRRCLVVGGVGAASTSAAVEMASLIQANGCDAVLLVAPPYLKPTQAGIYEHFKAVAVSITLPIIAYNIPSRTGVNILPETIEQLAAGNLISGIKESAGSMDQALQLIERLGDHITILSGEDGLVHPLVASGAHGAVSASANLLPHLFVHMVNSVARRELSEAKEAQLCSLPYVRGLFLEPNPVPVKFALMQQGIIKHDSVRLPLLRAQKSTRELLEELLSEPLPYRNTLASSASVV